jgi:hypothetical protein
VLELPEERLRKVAARRDWIFALIGALLGYGVSVGLPPILSAIFKPTPSVETGQNRNNPPALNNSGKDSNSGIQLPVKDEGKKVEERKDQQSPQTTIKNDADTKKPSKNKDKRHKKSRV